MHKTYSTPLPENFSLRDTLLCGQAFRWNEMPDGSFSGYAGIGSACRAVNMRQKGDTLLLVGGEEADIPFWRDYLDLDGDYSCRCAFEKDDVLRGAVDYCGGIRILRQDPFETLISFIISANNNIPRIKLIIDRLCELLGGEEKSFPTAEALASLTIEELAPIRAGFRAKYILDAAKKVASGELDLAAVAAADLDTARVMLQTVSGVGPKVAECVLLYGFHRLEAFPVDTWIKKVLARYYPEGFPDWARPKGIAQQYLFHYIRHIDKE